VSTWDLIEQTIMTQPVALPLSARELYVVKEAHAAWVRRTLDEVSAWDVLEQVKILMEAPGDPPELTKAVKGLDPREVQLIRHFKGNAKSKTGNTGEVVALSPKEWIRIKQEIQRQPDYYDKMLGNVVSADGLAKKIEQQVALATGQKPAQAPPEPVQSPPELSGKPSDITPFVQGPEQYGNMPPGKSPPQPPTLGTTYKSSAQLGQTGGGSPFAKKTGAAAGAPPRPVSAPQPEDDAAARRRRVAAQDMRSMGAKSKSDLDKIMASGKVKI
jgi:hypothetical protein